MKEILVAINEELMRLTSKLSMERRFPSNNPDTMDENIHDCEDRIKVLREIRTKIEDAYI